MNVAGRFGENLAHLRKRAGLSQEDASFRAGLHRTEVSSLERGKRLPRVDTVAKLAAAVEANPGELFAGISWQPGELRPGRFESAIALEGGSPQAEDREGVGDSRSD